MCTYKEKKTEPSEMLQLDGYTVDYIEAASGKTNAAPRIASSQRISLVLFRFFVTILKLDSKLILLLLQK